MPSMSPFAVLKELYKIADSLESATRTTGTKPSELKEKMRAAAVSLKEIADSIEEPHQLQVSELIDSPSP
jgi:uncharacterized protein YacL